MWVHCVECHLFIFSNRKRLTFSRYHAALISVCVKYIFYFISHSPSGLPIDTVQWDLSNLPMRTSSVDIIITDMPFGKRYCDILKA